MSEINAKLAALVDDSRIAINAGSNKGVAEGDEVVLFRTVEVTDPDTGESLGSVDVRKLALEIELVREKMSVAIVTDIFVGDNEPTDFMSTLLKPKRRKRVAFNVPRGDKRTVQVVVGERAVVHLSQEQGERSA
ncbi:FlgT C-terminal domain-containing protein [Streptomyces sp. NPDC102462]|uniref:FlgT C-terminal domain-containing protein n=1 Tax=Streptomyces sp. NPDC102462 TaxID=3366178 RepID=UPI00381DE038